MRILFYLPAVTTWWFDNIILPTMRTLHQAPSAELHVMIAPVWRGLGVEADQLWAASDLDRVHWHVIDHGEPDQFLHAGYEVPGLLDLVSAIDPALTIARSADLDTPRRFPGVVRYIMEGDASPFADRHRRMVIEPEPFRPGLLPEGDAELVDRCIELMNPCWDFVMSGAMTDMRGELRVRLGLPLDQPVIALPLLYEHHENLFLRHAGLPKGVEAIEAVLATLPSDAVLAVTDHPLNQRFVDRTAVDVCMARHADRVIYCPQPNATEMLAASVDAMIVDLSKSWSLAAFYGTPIIHVGRLPMPNWLRPVEGLEALPAALATGCLPRPDAATARRWFSWHFGARSFYPGTLELDRLLRNVAERPSETDIIQNCEVLLTGLHEQRDIARAA